MAADSPAAILSNLSYSIIEENFQLVNRIRNLPDN